MTNKIFSLYRQYKIHIICWSCFIAYEILLVGTLAGNFGSFLDNAAHYVVNIGLFYFHATVVLPFVVRQKRKYFWLLPFLVFAEVATYIGVIYSVEYLLTNYFQVELVRPLSFTYHYTLRSIWRAIFFLGFGTGYYFLRTTLQERKRAENAEKQHLLQQIEKQDLQHELIRAQNAFLKAQINPHFLFNTLNFVYNSVRKTSVQAAETILSLSQMMRYALESGEDDQEISLLAEVEQVENLIHLHQVRHDYQLQVQLTYDQQLAGIRLIPLVLLTLVENVFKHGNLLQPGSPATIDLSCQNNRLIIRTANLKLHDQQSGHRIGLDNIQRRLLQFYHERASFRTYNDEKGYFYAELKVILPALVNAATYYSQAEEVLTKRPQV